ncbi:hypothetical protein CRG98_005917 [Punica granatum]|uniref:MULE transposase domain-containing protein n=1 Tax=Punica granatum TaxID=22663 RepID=A0A2I0L0N2_PUNGR|nr:hypothetical protein CRG98_005917 [Punica granatum]
MKQEAANKKRHEEIEMMEQEAIEKMRHKEEMETIGPEVWDWDEEDDDMEFEQFTQPSLEEIQCVNANVEASQVRIRKKSIAVKKRKQKEKGDDVEETPTMDDRLSNGYNSEELESLARDSDEENDKFPMYNAEDNRTVEIPIGMEFENLDVFKMAVRNTNIAIGREVQFMKNDKVFEFFVHTYQVKLHDAMVFWATKLAKQKCGGEEMEQYAMLRDYAHEILRSNPSSTVLLQVQPETHEFKRLYICLDACKKGFQEGCRPIIGLDGCFLKGYYGGQLLSSVSQDGNNSFFVIAYAIVEVECTESWKWFLQNLISDVGDPIEKKYTFIFDMRKGLDAAIKEVCDGAPHRFCNRHIWANLTKHAKCNGGELRRAFWNCVKATTPQRFT